MDRMITFVGVFFFFSFFKGVRRAELGASEDWISARGSIRAGCGVAARTAPGQGSSPRRCSLARGRGCGHSSRRPPGFPPCPPGSPSHLHQPRPVRQACRPDHEAALGTAQASCALGFQKGPELRRLPQGAAVEWGWALKSPSE